MSERAVPILPSRDLAKTLRFYQSLGFENRGAPPEQWHYLIVGRGELELHFAEDPTVDPLSTAGSCFLYVDDADALFLEWNGVVIPDAAAGTRVTEPVNTDYRMREFAVVDDNGNQVRVGTAL